MPNLIDLTGKVFGRWTVLYRAEDRTTPKGTKLAYWHCKCSCEKGTEKDVNGDLLRNGNSKSCGCLAREVASKRNLKDLTGMKFGRLTVVERADDYVNNGKHYTRWKCVCDCGNPQIKIVTGGALKNGKVVSCGCYHDELIAEKGKQNKKYNAHKHMGKYEILYTQKGEPFYVDAEDYSKIKDVCWFKTDDGYIEGNLPDKVVLLHIYIMEQYENALVVDHIGGHKTRHDCRKVNLRIGTEGQNHMNTKLPSDNKSGVTGVHFDKNRQKWLASIGLNNKSIHLGRFDSFDDAVKARKEAEEKYFGEWSYDNSQRYYKENNPMGSIDELDKYAIDAYIRGEIEVLKYKDGSYAKVC